MMKKITGVFAAVFAALLCASLSGCNMYNGMVAASEAVDSQWANVENRYQERMDLVPNLVATVKGYAAQEKDVYTSVAEARAKCGGVVNVDVDDAESMEKFQKAQSELSSSLQRLLAVTEAYPELKSNENFMDLQNQLEGIENRIATERKKYNDAVQSYNRNIKSFPNNLMAGKWGFKEKTYFKADEAAAKAPVVQF